MSFFLEQDSSVFQMILRQGRRCFEKFQKGIATLRREPIVDTITIFVVEAASQEAPCREIIHRRFYRAERDYHSVRVQPGVDAYAGRQHTRVRFEQNFSFEVGKWGAIRGGCDGRMIGAREDSHRVLPFLGAVLVAERFGEGCALR